jgi:hypothetical protein
MEVASNTRERLEIALGDDSAGRDLIRNLGIGAAEFTVNAEVANVITTNIQLKNKYGEELTEVTAVEVWLFSAAAATAVNAQNYTTIAAGTDGVVLERIADTILDCTTEADGDLDIAITLSSGAATCYLGVKLADGTFAFSGAITHAV